VLIIASPLGLLAPGTGFRRMGKTGTCRPGIGYIPTGIEKFIRALGGADGQL